MCSEHKRLRGNRLCDGPSGKMTRFVQPCLLLALYTGPSYGYELIERIGEFEFCDKIPDAALVYRQLYKLERNGYIVSEWHPGDIGPAKKYYKLTPVGVEFLHSWAAEIEKRKKALEDFLSCYHKYTETHRP